jgi:hypothetical protein
MKAMQEQGTQTISRGVRALNLAVAAALVAGGAWAAYRFGPKPSGAKRGEGEVARKAPAPAAAPTVQAADRQAELGLPAFGMFDAGRTRVGGGIADGTPEEFLAATERKYLERGFRPAPIGRDAAAAPKTPGASSGRMYYRADCPIPMLLAFGRGADPTVDAGAGEPGAYMTVCAPSRDGRTEWATFRYRTDDRALAESLERFRSGDMTVDFPGEDPAGIPRAPGSRRLLSVTRPLPAGKGVVALYQIKAPIDEVRRYYTEEMALRAWRLDTFTTNQAAAFGRGVLCYTQGQRLCTLWIDQKSPGDEIVHVFVSSR